MAEVDHDSLATAQRLALAYQDPLVGEITTSRFSFDYPDGRDWAIGPFRRDEALTLRELPDWADPTGVGWTSTSVFNPSPILAADGLHVFYRASPRKESLGSRIGHAVLTGDGWQDDPGNPLVWPTLPNEVLGVEDPKVYRAGDGSYVLFYNAIWDASVAEGAEADLLASTPMPGIGCDIMVATSTDLTHWRKLGPVVPREVSRGWAKGAVIPRTPAGDAVTLGGQYLMYLSEGCGGRQFVGRSPDLLTWSFSPRTYLDLAPLSGTLYEVACASIGHDSTHRLVLDFFYRDDAGQLAAGQALYDPDDPFRQRDLSRGGTLAWGGLVSHGDGLYFAQGWDAPDGVRELSWFRAERPAGEPSPPGTAC